MTDKQPPKKPAKPTPPARKQPASKQPAARKTAARKVAAKKVPAKKAAPVKPAPKTPTPPARKTPGKAPTKKAQADAKAAESAKKSVTDLVGEANRAVGRPTKYTDEVIPQMMAFFNIDVERTEEVVLRDKKGNPVLDKDNQPVLEKIVVANRFPTLERFAAKIGVTRETLHDWATATNEDGSLIRPEFSYTYTRAKNLQAALLVEGGLHGNYESRVVNFALKNLAGWKDQIEQTIVADVSTTASDKLDEIYEQGIRKAALAKQAALSRKLTGTVPGEAGKVEPGDA